MTSDVTGDSRPGKPTQHEGLVLNYDDSHAAAQNSKFRFKSSKRKLKNDDEDGNSNTSSHKDGRRHRHHHHRSKRKRCELLDDPSTYDDTHLPNGSSSQNIDPDTAFRESLFDAMADDEDAQFWEGVYGQPIPKIPPVKEGPTGKLETMTDEEYAAHVRAEMYKKTHQYLIEERERREKAKKEKEKKDVQRTREAEEADKFRKQVSESLRRGEERKNRMQRASIWAQKWKDYEGSWFLLVDRMGTGGLKIPWPVFDGKRATINKEEIERFFLNAPTSGQPDQAELLKTLKTERVRWHPDKMQQKLGGQRADEMNMRSVTAVFQIIDRMWTEMRDSNSNE